LSARRSSEIRGGDGVNRPGGAVVWYSRACRSTLDHLDATADTALDRLHWLTRAPRSGDEGGAIARRADTVARAAARWVDAPRAGGVGCFIGAPTWLEDSSVARFDEPPGIVATLAPPPNWAWPAANARSELVLCVCGLMREKARVLAPAITDRSRTTNALRASSRAPSPSCHSSASRTTSLRSARRG
jgi:hypothetical protein